MSRSIFVDRLCCSRALDNPTLQLPEKQVDTEEHYDNYNIYSKTRRNGDDHQDDYNKRDGDLFLNSFPDLLPPFTTKPDPGKNKNFPVSTRRRLERLKCLHVQYSCAVRYNLHCMGVTNCRMVSPVTLTTIFSTVLVRVFFLL